MHSTTLATSTSMVVCLWMIPYCYMIGRWFCFLNNASRLSYYTLWLGCGSWILANLLHTLMPPLYNKSTLFRTINFITVGDRILWKWGSTIYCGSLMDLGRTLLHLSLPSWGCNLTIGNSSVRFEGVKTEPLKKFEPWIELNRTMKPLKPNYLKKSKPLNC